MYWTVFVMDMSVIVAKTVNVTVSYKIDNRCHSTLKIYVGYAQNITQNSMTSSALFDLPGIPNITDLKHKKQPLNHHKIQDCQQILY